MTEPTSLTGAEILEKLAALREKVPDPRGTKKLTFAFAEYVGREESRYFAPHETISPEAFVERLIEAVKHALKGKNSVTGLYVDEAILCRPPPQYGYILKDIVAATEILFPPEFAAAVAEITTLPTTRIA
jgi:hypothetical protein